MTLCKIVKLCIKIPSCVNTWIFKKCDLFLVVFEPLWFFKRRFAKQQFVESTKRFFVCTQPGLRDFKKCVGFCHFQYLAPLPEWLNTTKNGLIRIQGDQKITRYFTSLPLLLFLVPFPPKIKNRDDVPLFCLLLLLCSTVLGGMGSSQEMLAF